MTTTSTEISLLRLATAGSVDDGKSTLVGRLLHDCKAVLADQWAAAAQASRQRGLQDTDLALLTDGLRAEREQGITIDVAYRYFATLRRRFILADTPGHVQYTRNMVTGASTAQLAVVLVDARNGIVEQTRRHAAVTALLRVPHVVLAVNKMDLVGYDENVFAEVADRFVRYARELGIPETTAIPLSALRGDNVVNASAHMEWYGGPTLLEHLEAVDVEDDPTTHAARFPVQHVLRPRTPGEYRDYRGYAGQLVAGTLHLGEAVTVLPSGHRTTIAAIDHLGPSGLDTAIAPQSVSLRLADDIDVSRGDMIVAGRPPELTRTIRAMACHLHERPLHVGDRVLVQHAARTVRALVTAISHRIDLLHGFVRVDEPDALRVNDIGAIELRTSEPLPVDRYAQSRRTGSFLLIDSATGDTLTAGMVGEAFGADGGATSPMTAERAM